jgi:hypothetical protein
MNTPPTSTTDADDLSRLSDDDLELRLFNQDRVVTFARLMDSPVGAELAEKANRALTATVVEIGRRGTSTLLDNEDWAALHESAIQARAERDRPTPTDH